MSKTCQQCKSEFTIYPEDRKFYDKIDVPEPTLCPDCRMQRIMASRNDYKLYQRKCDLCKKDVISIYSADKSFPVYCSDCWWSDRWDPMKYALDFDFSLKFADQFKELQRMVPRIALFNRNTENSKYNNDIADSKNCYLSSRVFFGCEDVYYSYWVFSSSNVYYSGKVYNSEIVYRSFDCRQSYNILYSQYVENSRDCLFSYDLKNCQNCILCVGLRNKKFYIDNKEVSPEEFEASKRHFLRSRKSINELKSKLEQKKLSYPRLASIVLNSDKCSGSDLRYCKDCHRCFDLRESDSCRYVMAGAKNEDSVDVYSFQECEKVYDSTDTLRVNNIIGGRFIWDSHAICYGELCFGSSDLFGCIGLRGQHNCILNKQYSVDDYRKLKTRLVAHMKETGEWGQSFVLGSVFGYNETPAQDAFPLAKSEALNLGYGWFDQPRGVKGRETMRGADVPATIDETGENIIDQVVSCSNCKRNFKIISEVFNAHKRLSLPLNTLCPDCERRQLYKNWYKPAMYDRKCAKCGADIQTTYAPDRPEMVYCEKCYQNLVS